MKNEGPQSHPNITIFSRGGQGEGVGDSPPGIGFQEENP